MWDTRTANSPDAMLANSSYVRSRIRRIYGRDSEVIFPPVHMNEVQYREDKDDYFVTASFLAPYKRTDLVIDAFNAMPTRRLVVVGEGQQLDHLRKRARPNVSFTGYLSRTDYMRTVASARAFVFAGCEDFGIALAEAQACGTPVVAFGRGGARDIVRPADDDETGRTGILFDAQSVDSLIAAIEEFEADASGISSRACRQNAQRFSDERFRREIGNAVGHLIAAY
jgi:glycosyltransferase involved in cell wall biosynthesis